MEKNEMIKEATAEEANTEEKGVRARPKFLTSPKKAKPLYKDELKELNDKIDTALKKISDKVGKFADKIAKILWTWFLIGLVLHVSAYFWPELPENIPAVYGFYDHVMGCLEFTFWTMLKGLQALFEGRFFEFCNGEWKDAFNAGWNGFIEWIKSL